MAEEVAEYYQCSAGLTIGMTVCQEGEVVEGSAMGFSETNPPLSVKEQHDKFGQVLYAPYTPDEEEVAGIKGESARIRAMAGMQDSTLPRVTPVAGVAEPPLDTLSRQELRAKAKKMGLNFPADTDRDQMIGAISKKEQETAETPEEEEEET